MYLLTKPFFFLRASAPPRETIFAFFSFAAMTGLYPGAVLIAKWNNMRHGRTAAALVRNQSEGWRA
jgi:hypothetical protein